MKKEAYGTVEYYKTYFLDILADAANHDDIDKNLPQMQRILEGFKLAVEEWLQYHTTAATTYQRLLQAFLADGSVVDEADDLPPIPPIPSIYK